VILLGIFGNFLWGFGFCLLFVFTENGFCNWPNCFGLHRSALSRKHWEISIRMVGKINREAEKKGQGVNKIWTPDSLGFDKKITKLQKWDFLTANFIWDVFKKDKSKPKINIPLGFGFFCSETFVFCFLCFLFCFQFFSSIAVFHIEFCFLDGGCTRVGCRVAF